MSKQRKQHTTAESALPVSSFPPDDPKRTESRREDILLIRRAQKGDQKAFERLRQKYLEALRRFIRQTVKKQEEVDDLVQEAFIKAFTSLASFSEEYAFSTWLFKIAANNTIDYLRKRKLPTFSINAPIESDDDEYTFELPDHDPIPDQRLIAQQRKAFLEEAMASLPPKYRQVILMRHVEEKEYSEIARALKLPLGTVKAHIFRAREMLYKQLKDKLRHY